MAEKDMAEKTLEAYNDVFADIVNVLLFDGRPLVKEDELEEESPRSVYKADGKLHEQERDVAKFWKKCGVRIALYGLENQTEADADMPFRVISYDGSAYRAQLLKPGQRERFPVVTLVLYFGKGHWKAPKSLLEAMAVPEELKPYVNDYKINVFEIPYLTPEQVNLFQSDFKVVADYFVQVRMNADYAPSREQLDHVHEVLQLMSVLTKDDRFEVAAGSWVKGEATSMCEVLDKVEARGVARGISIGEARGMQQGIQQGLTKTATAMLAKGFAPEVVAECTGLSLEQVVQLAPRS